jgi:nucleoid-associated protein YejK
VKRLNLSEEAPEVPASEAWEWALIVENLQVRRIAVHEVFRRKADKRPITPTYATQLEILSADATQEFRARITEALSAQAKSVQMDIIAYGADSHLADAEALLAADDTEFLHISQACADRLTRAQLQPGLPGGMLIVLDGTVGAHDAPFVCVIKAEMQSGFRRQPDGGSIVTQLLKDIFLTKATRLYKVGFMVRESVSEKRPEGWTALVFDHNITQSHREAAAQYFYEGFLGCVFKGDGAYETARFFDLTREFVARSSLPVEEKRDVNDALYTYIKTEKSPTFTSDEFAEKYLPKDMQDPFRNFLEAKHFPRRAVMRDTARLGAKLRRRRFKFGAAAEFFASPDALSQKKVEITSGPAQEFGGEGDEAWTRIIVHQEVTEER